MSESPEPQPPAPAAPPPREAAAAAVRAIVVPLLAAGAMMLVVTGLVLVVVALEPSVGGVAGLSLETQMRLSAAGYLPALAVLAWAWRRLDQLPFRAMGYAGPLARAARGLGGGLAVGTVAMAAVVAVGTLAGGYRFEAGAVGPWLEAVVTWLPVLVLASHFEEATFRGYVLQNLGRRSIAAGVTGSSILFAAIHLSNPNVTEGGVGLFVLLAANIVLAGAWLSTVFLRRGDLWWPTGAHLGWNVAQGLIFGLPVSGLELPGLLRGSVTEARSLTYGGRFGPESSLLATGILALLLLEGIVALRRAGARLPLERDLVPAPGSGPPARGMLEEAASAAPSKGTPP